MQVLEQAAKAWLTAKLRKSVAHRISAAEEPFRLALRQWLMIIELRGK